MCNLPGTSFTYISTHKGGLESDWLQCENCGRAIANFAIIENEEGKSFTVGLDCADTITGIAKDKSYKESKSSLIKVGKFLREAKKVNKPVTFDSSFVDVSGMPLGEEISLQVYDLHTVGITDIAAWIKKEFAL